MAGGGLADKTAVFVNLIEGFGKIGTLGIEGAKKGDKVVGGGIFDIFEVTFAGFSSEVSKKLVEIILIFKQGIGLDFFRIDFLNNFLPILQIFGSLGGRSAGFLGFFTDSFLAIAG